MDRLISVNRLKQSYQHLDTEDYYRKVFDKLIDEQPTVDPMAKGQWLNYQMILKIIRMEEERVRVEEQDPAGANALEELAGYFEKLSGMIGGEGV